jgi:hypothetical protein
LYSFNCYDNYYEIGIVPTCANKNNVITLDLPDGFDPSKTSNWSGGTYDYETNELTIDPDTADTISYDYDTGYKDVTFYLSFTRAEHDYSSGGVCTICGDLENGKDSFKSASLTLNEGVTINYKLILSDEAISDEGAYVHFTSEQGLDKKIYFKDSILEDAEIGKYRFSLDLTPDMMADVITATIIYSDGSEGASIDYSVTEYAESLSDSDNEKLINLLNATLEYGAYTQLYTGHNSSNLAAIITGYTENAEISDDYKKTVSGDDVDGIDLKSATLQIGALTTIRIRYQIDDEHSISEYSFDCDGNNLEAEKIGDYYYIYIKGIKPTELNKMYTITVSDGTASKTLNYSAFSYAKSAFANPDDFGEQIVNIMNALYYYNQAAIAYEN